MLAAARRALEGAKSARSDTAAARAAVEEALRLAPDDVEVRMAAYKFHFYNHEYAFAVGHADFCIGAFARKLGVSPDWRDVRPKDADFSALDQQVGWYLQALIAWGYCRARAGEPIEGRTGAGRRRRPRSDGPLRRQAPDRGDRPRRRRGRRLCRVRRAGGTAHR